MKHVTAILGTGILLLSLSSSIVIAQDWQGEAHDAWIDGKLEAAYLFNTELNNFMIDTAVEQGMVTLSGEVGSETHRELAGEIAKTLEGVNGVTNNLVIGEEGGLQLKEKEQAFRTRFFDLTTTARLKSAYALDDQLSALDINIDTRDGVVTLTGKVDSAEAKQHAEQLAAEYEHVTAVDNQLNVLAFVE